MLLYSTGDPCALKSLWQNVNMCWITDATAVKRSDRLFSRWHSRELAGAILLRDRYSARCLTFLWTRIRQCPVSRILCKLVNVSRCIRRYYPPHRGEKERRFILVFWDRVISKQILNVEHRYLRDLTYRNIIFRILFFVYDLYFD